MHIAALDFEQRFQHGQPDITDHAGLQLGHPAHIAAHRGDGAFAIATGDRDQPHRMLTLGIQRMHGARKQFHVTDHFHVAGDGLCNRRLA